MSLLKNNNAKFAFFYMLSLVALLFVALGTGQILFNGINYFIKDLPGVYSNPFLPVTGAISMLIIAAPIYFWTMWNLERDLVKGKLDSDAPIRRWLVYFILFVSAVVLLVWLIITLSNFLDGELTSKALLKFLTVILIGGSIFSYYFYDIRRDSIKKKDIVVRSYFIGALILTVGSLVFSFFFAPSPAEARARKHDDRIIEHFVSLDNAVNNFYSKNERLPNSMQELREEASYLDSAYFKDPATGQAYEYRKVDEASFELCADFQTSNKEGEDSRVRYPYYGADERWQHDAGRQCLKQKAIDYTSNDQGGATKPVPIR